MVAEAASASDRLMLILAVSIAVIAVEVLLAVVALRAWRRRSGVAASALAAGDAPTANDGPVS